MSSTENKPSTYKCDFCESNLRSPCHAPSGSRMSAEIYICSKCGLAQSQYRVIPETKVRTLSCDADWGNVRHGKGVRFSHLKNVIETHIELEKIKVALDVGSNRGDFVLWMNQVAPDCIITAVEPDSSITENYENTSGINVCHKRLEDLLLHDKSFDLVFCSHTLEHATSASDMLKQIHNALKPGGWLLLEVPNIESTSLENVVEEFFIDKHTFHFDRRVLIDFVTQRGFSIAESFYVNNDPVNITLLLQRTDLRREYIPSAELSNSITNEATLLDYADRLKKNRNLLKKLVDEKIRPLASRQKVAFWGASRIFDALVKYGALASSDVHILVDKYLAGIVDKTHGIAIERPERLRLTEPNVVIVLGNSAEDVIAKRAYELGVRHVVKFSELMDQVREN